MSKQRIERDSMRIEWDAETLKRRSKPRIEGSGENPEIPAIETVT